MKLATLLILSAITAHADTLFIQTPPLATKSARHGRAIAESTAKAGESAVLRVAVTIYAESKGESMDGKRAVASVIYNRAGDAMTRNRITWDAALIRTCQRPAFSCWPRHGWPKAPRMDRPSERQAWYAAYELARQIEAGIFEPTTPATHYAERSIRNYWTTQIPMLADVGNHRFYQ